MTSIDFYFNVASRPQVVRNLVKSALLKRRQVTIFTDDEIIASELNHDLWQNEAISFLPNVLINHAHAARTPVIIYCKNNQAEMHALVSENSILQDDMLINLTAHEPIFFSRFKQLIELVTDNEQDKTIARQRYKFYRDRGYTIKNIDQAKMNPLNADKTE